MSVVICSPSAHLVWLRAAGHCTVIVLDQTPVSGSRTKCRAAFSVPTTVDVETFGAVLDELEETEGMRGWWESFVSTVLTVRLLPDRDKRECDAVGARREDGE